MKTIACVISVVTVAVMTLGTVMILGVFAVEWVQVQSRNDRLQSTTDQNVSEYIKQKSAAK